MNKKLISLLLACAMALCLMPTAAMAAGAPEWVTNALGMEGYEYNSSAKTLTITSDAHMTATLAVPSDLILDLNGHTLTGAADVIAAVTVADGATLTVESTGDAAGKILGADDYDGKNGQHAVYSDDGYIEISANATVQGGKATGANSEGGAGAACDGAGSITINEGGTAKGGNGSNSRGGFGAYSREGSITINAGGTAIGGDGANGGDGAYGDNNHVIVSGTATGGNGIDTGGNGASSICNSVTVDGTVTGGNGKKQGGHGALLGQNSEGDLTIEGGGRAQGGDATGTNGIGGIGAFSAADTDKADKGRIVIADGGTAIGGNGASPGKGADAPSDDKITNGGTVVKGSLHTGEISADDVTATYGDAEKPIGATDNGNRTLLYSVTQDGDVIAISADGRLTFKNAGEATVTVRADRTDDYSAAEKTVEVEVKQKALKITADSRGILTREAIPEFTVTVEGLISGETISGIQFDKGGAAAGVAGSYTITPFGGTISRGDTVIADGLNNYAVDYVPGTLTITAVDVSSLNAAIKAANEAKNGIAADDRPAEQVPSGRKFVTTAEMKALTDAIQAAIAKLATVNTKAEAEAAAELLNEAIDTFTVAIKTGSGTAPSGGTSGGGSNAGSGYIAPAQNSAQNAKGDIRISGVNIPSGDVLITTPTQNGALMKLLGGNTLIGIWDISLRSGRTSIPGSTLSFNVGRENAGKNFTLYHQKADGTVESFSATADLQGIVSFYPINELSPFMLVQGGGIVTTSIVSVPATGGMDAGLGLMLLSAIMAAAVAMKRRKTQA